MIDVNSELRKDCPMRHENGNCTTCGGFCTAVNDPICEGLHSAYDAGWYAALRAQQEAEKNNALELEANRDAWKRRAEAAERDIIAMLRAHVDDMHCDQCTIGNNRESCRYYGKDMCPVAEWRGPCEGKEGAT